VRVERDLRESVDLLNEIESVLKRRR
jgi:hypothetical protein